MRYRGLFLRKKKKNSKASRLSRDPLSLMVVFLLMKLLYPPGGKQSKYGKNMDFFYSLPKTNKHIYPATRAFTLTSI